MFNLFKKADKTVASKTIVDIHSHLIPGIDDGSKSMEESIELIRTFSKLGYKKLITTPHIMSDQYRNTPETILSGLASLKQTLSDLKIDIDIEAAAEYYLDEGFDNLLQDDKLLTFGSGYLLVETSYAEKHISIEDVIFSIQTRGLKPILAHPERYRYINDMEYYKKLKDLGVYFQLNLNSIHGGYGKSAQKKAHYLIKNGMIDFVGSDVHHARHIDGLKKALADKWYNRIFDKSQILNDSLLEKV